MLEAKKQGKVKHLGFSAHTTKGALEAMKGFRFDTVMFRKEEQQVARGKALQGPIYPDSPHEFFCSAHA